jgi:hypothetical protein
MAWLLLLGGFAFIIVLRLARRRRAQFTVRPSEPISTIHLEMSKKQTAKVRAALDAATSALR